MNEIFEYIRRRKGGKTHQVGVIVAVEKDRIIRLGWSKCNRKLGDEFDPKKGLNIACDRAYGKEQSPTAPLCIQTQIRRFGSRAVRYFHNAKGLEMPV